jgi:hypothetical protein
MNDSSSWLVRLPALPSASRVGSYALHAGKCICVEGSENLCYCTMRLYSLAAAIVPSCVRFQHVCYKVTSKHLDFHLISNIVIATKVLTDVLNTCLLDSLTLLPFLCNIFIFSEDRDSMSLPNCGICLPNFTVSHPSGH